MRENTTENQIGILGAGGQADEVEAYYGEAGGEVMFKAVDEQYINQLDEIPHIDISNPTESQKIAPVIAAIGAPGLRKEMVEKWTGGDFVTVQSNEAYVDKSANIGEGSIIAPRAVITTNVELGRHVLVNVAATISHNTKVGEYTTIGPGAHIGGDVVIGEGVFIGIGALISNRVNIASGTVVGAGAVVLNDVVVENSVVVGVPARVVKENEGWLREL